jgi:tRNA(Ile)-lysidine synthase
VRSGSTSPADLPTPVPEMAQIAPVSVRRAIFRVRAAACDPGTVTAPPAADDLVAALAARCPLLPGPDQAVTCAVSGGADSLALLALVARAGARVTAVHVDHGLRPGSAAEADVVAAAAERLGAAFRTERVDVPPGPNLEARARDARYAVLGPDALTGHTADDQAETVLLNVLRGAGLDGLAAMRPDRRRPLLALRRRETVEVCAALGLAVVDDPSNADPAFTRNRIRHEVLPLLDAVARRDVVPVLSRLAAHAREAVDHLDEEVAAGGFDVVDARALAGQPPALAHRAVRAWLSAAERDGGHPPDAATVGRVLAVARGEAVGADVGRGWQVRRSKGRLRLVPPGSHTVPPTTVRTDGRPSPVHYSEAPHG